MKNRAWIGLVVLAIAACADGDPALPGTEIGAIRVTPAQATVAIGDTVELGATVVATDGRELESVAVEWNLADDDVASILVSGRTARLVGRATGTATVAVRTGAVTASVTVAVENPVPQTSAIFPMNAPAGSAGLELHVYGSAFVPGTQVLWNGTARPTVQVSATELVAQVEAAELAIAGTAEVRVRSPLPGGGVSPERQVFRIDAAAVTRLTLTPATLSLGAGETAALAARAEDASGQEVPGAAVTWQSSNPEVAAVQGGMVQGIAAGAAVITASVGSVAASATVTVNPAGPGVPVIERLTPDSALAGSVIAFTVVGRNFAANAGVFVGATGQPTERISDRELRVQLWAEQAAQSGTVQLRAYNPGPGGGWSEPVSFRILPRPTTVVIDLSTPLLFVGEAMSATARVLDEQGRELAGVPVTFESADAAVARVDAAGVIRAVGAGSTTIRARTNASVTGVVAVHVRPEPEYELLYESRVTGHPELWLARANGSNARRLMPGVWASDPAVTADGSRIAFVGTDASGNRDIYVVNRDGSGLTRMTTDAAVDDQPAWSPDGSRLAWRNATDWYSDIWVMNADGSGRRNLLDSFVRIGMPHAERPTFTPDGSNVTFSYGDRAFAPFTATLFVRPLDQDLARPLTAFTGSVDTEAAYAATGTVLAARRTHPNYGDRIVLLDAQTGTEYIMLNEIGPGSTPAWTPDAQWLAFSYADGTSTSRNLYLTLPGYGLRRRVLAGGENAVWLRR